MKKNYTLQKKKNRFLIILFIAFGFSTSIFSQSVNDFVTTWQTNPTEYPSDTSILIPGQSDFNYDVDWNNDGVFDELGISGDVTHDYGTAGTYTIRIRGSFTRPHFYRIGVSEKIISVDQWGNTVWASMGNAFEGASNFVLNATDVPDLSNVEYMNSMFFECTLFNSNINNWDVSNVIEMSTMFLGATAFNQPLNNWNVGEVTNMDSMFSNATSFNQDISSWVTSKVLNMTSMFSEATAFNQNINGWNVGEVLNMLGMFENATNFNQPLNNWDVSEVTNMYIMFYAASAFDQPLNNWNITNVTDMRFMFDNVALSTINYDNTLIGWASQTVNNNIIFSGGNSNYCNGDTARASLESTYNWTITDAGYDCSGLSVDDYLLEAISFYPNPVENIIYFNTENVTIENVLIYSVQGKLIKKSKMLNNTIDIQNLESGIYFMKIRTEKGVATRKFIKE